MVAHHRILHALRYVGRHERGTLISLLIVLASVLLFAELGELAVDPAEDALDRRILLAMRAPEDPLDPLGPRWFEEMMRDLTAFGGVAVQSMVGLAVVGYLLLERKRHAAVFLALATAGGAALSFVLKDLYERSRPMLEPAMEISTASFPSGHSMMSAVTYLTLGALLARTQQSALVRAYLLLLAVLLTIAVGFTRVYLGVHWPTDVLAGWTGGAAWALLCWTIALRLQRERVVESPAFESAAPGDNIVG